MTKTTTITVQEIHCESCEHTIATALSRLSGVLRVTPDVKTNQVKISYDERSLNETNLRSALADIGYDPIA
ncbi:heavy-metal-associated domain-containing protein [Ferrimicrobium sp.]|uniref:heavy-metal-associated domain-containing protein n=1 Tax=Ferrimicrobium sp. TaxID=2926050 RepID=UPI0026221808|nr:heavy-metal-associated domain-containing protein [Ferrimicrobium sp.]